MPVFERGEVRIHYAETGDPKGPPVLLIAPGGMRSAFAMWNRAAFNPMARLTRYRVIAMDQRNAGTSWAPVRSTDGWDTYTADQIALLDHLGIHRFAVLGMCIGGPYALGLIRAAPERVRCAVLFQPIGLDNNRQAFFEMFDAWATDIAAEHPEATPETWTALRQTMFGGDFVFNALPDEVARCPTPLLIAMGDDLYHPQSISRHVARLAPHATLIEDWKTDQAQVDTLVHGFLDAH